MSEGVVQNQIKVLLSDQRVTHAPFDNAKVGLLDDAYAGPWDQTAGNGPLGNEAAWAGYVRQTLTGWSGGILLADGHAQNGATVALFANTSGGPVTTNGWFFYGVVSGKIIMLGEFPAPITIPDGASLPLAPFWTSTGE